MTSIESKGLLNTRVQTVDRDNVSAWIVTGKGDRFEGDIFVGADGHRSIVRRHVAPHKPDATFAGYLMWVAVVVEKTFLKNTGSLLMRIKG